jgi:hypothetical protein
MCTGCTFSDHARPLRVQLSDLDRREEAAVRTRMLGEHAQYLTADALKHGAPATEGAPVTDALSA